MEKDFHYYMTYAMVKLTGCAQPDIIAYACQFVDDNNEGQFTVDEGKITFPIKLKAGVLRAAICVYSLSFPSRR
jgi:hypothetical protein